MSEVAEGIPAIASGYVGQKVTQSSFFSFCNPFCTGKRYFINTMFSFGFIFQSFFLTNVQRTARSLTAAPTSAPCEYEATTPKTYFYAAKVNATFFFFKQKYI